MHTPAVSVITCFLDEAQYLEAAIESVLAQTYDRWELLLVDDGSRDGSSAIAKDYAARYPGRIRYLEHEGHANRGLASSRNLGLGAARGRYVSFLDADDWIRPLHLEKLTAVFAGDPSLEAVYCGWSYATPDGSEAFGMYGGPRGDLFEPHAQYCFSVVHTYLVSRALVLEVGGFDTSLRSCEDWDLWQRIARTGARFGTVQERLALYRIRAGSMATDGACILEEGLMVVRRGHAPDPRISARHPVYPDGLPVELLPQSEYDLLCACAGYEIGSGREARALFGMLPGARCETLNPLDVARGIVVHALVASGRPKVEWADLWPSLRERIQSFLIELEARSGTANLAARAGFLCRQLVLGQSQGADFASKSASSLLARMLLAVREQDVKLRHARGQIRRSVGVLLALMPGARRRLLRVVGGARSRDRVSAIREGQHGGMTRLHTPLVRREAAAARAAPSPTLMILSYRLSTTGATDLDAAAGLERQLQSLQAAGFAGRTLQDWRRLIDLSATDLPPGLVLVFRDTPQVAEWAWPIVKRYDYPAVIMLNANTIRTRAADDAVDPRLRESLSWRTVRTLQSEGAAFGCDIGDATAGKGLRMHNIWKQLKLSREALESELGVPVPVVGFLGGGLSPLNRLLAGMAGFDYALSSGVGICSPAHSMLDLRTIDAAGSLDRWLSVGPSDRAANWKRARSHSGRNLKISGASES